LLERKHTFHLNQILLNLKVCSSTFMYLKLPTRSAKAVKTEATSIEQHVTHLFFSLNLNDALFRVFDLRLINFNWATILQIAFNCTFNCLQTFNFFLFHPAKLNCQLLSWLTFLFWSLVLNLCILTLNWPTNFQFLQFSL
jgi:hypothetical protein